MSLSLIASSRLYDSLSCHGVASQYQHLTDQFICSPARKNNTKKMRDMAAAARKHCNCKNSRCLKLYCECFASGRYCSECNCVSCCNNHENEGFRQSAVETILDRNPNAFRPKIQVPHPLSLLGISSQRIVEPAVIQRGHQKSSRGLYCMLYTDDWTTLKLPKRCSIDLCKRLRRGSS